MIMMIYDYHRSPRIKKMIEDNPTERTITINNEVSIDRTHKNDLKYCQRARDDVMSSMTTNVEDEGDREK